MGNKTLAGIVFAVAAPFLLAGAGVSVRNEVPDVRGVESSSEVRRYSDRELLAIAMYSEAAVEWNVEGGLPLKVVGRVGLNRVDDSGYPDDLYGVVFGRNALSSNGTKNWKQATGQLPMNAYEKRVWEQCLGHARDLLNGKELGIPHEYEIVAFDDVRSFEKVKKTRLNDAYWKYMEKVGQAGSMVYCIDKRG